MQHAGNHIDAQRAADVAGIRIAPPFGVQKRIVDCPLGADGKAGIVKGLGLLDIDTVMSAEKTTRPVSGSHCGSGTAIEGYEIHLGESQGDDCARPMVTIDGRPDGASSRDGRIQGTYVHGLFGSDAFRRAWLKGFGASSTIAYEARIEEALDALADHLDAHIDVDAVLRIARSRHRQTTTAA